MMKVSRQIRWKMKISYLPWMNLAYSNKMLCNGKNWWYIWANKMKHLHCEKCGWYDHGTKHCTNPRYKSNSETKHDQHIKTHVDNQQHEEENVINKDEENIQNTSTTNNIPNLLAFQQIQGITSFINETNGIGDASHCDLQQMLLNLAKTLTPRKF